MADKAAANIKINLAPFDKAAQAIREAEHSLAFALRSVDAFNNILRQVGAMRLLRQPTFSLTSQLNLFGWRHVDARDLTPGERWEYQCWIWRAPMRWVIGLWNCWQRQRHTYPYSQKLEPGTWWCGTNEPFVMLACPKCGAIIGLDAYLDMIDAHGTLVMPVDCWNCNWEGPVTLSDWNEPPDDEPPQDVRFGGARLTPPDKPKRKRRPRGF